MAVGLLREAEAAASGRGRFKEDTSWPRSLAAPVGDFLSNESGGAVILLAAALAALISANSPWPHSYDAVWTTTFSIQTGIHVDGDMLSRGVKSPIALGILLGHVIGKPIGVTLAANIALRLRVGPRALSEPAIAGVGLVAGVGFTVMLRISSLAFVGRQLEEVKLGILATAVVASLGSWAAFRLIARLPAPTRARQIAATIDDIVDLAEDVDLSRHLPLPDVHPHAQLAAGAAEAAAAQGAFWAIHDKLISHQDELTSPDLRRYATQLGLDTQRFWDEVGRHVYEERVQEDVVSADAGGVAGAPGFFVNGKRHDGAYDIATLSAAVRAERARAVAVGRHRTQTKETP